MIMRSRFQITDLKFATFQKIRMVWFGMKIEYRNGRQIWWRHIASLNCKTALTILTFKKYSWYIVIFLLVPEIISM